MYLGIDIGGTKTLVASFNDDGAIADKVKFPTADNYQTFLRELRNNVEQLNAANPSYCGVGMPGIIDRQHGVSSWSGGNLTWERCPLADDIAKIVGCPVALENDANLAGLSEANLIKDNYRKALYLTISTGIGGAFVVDGTLDPNTLNAEVGHMVYPQADGGYRTWEQLTSGKAIVDTYGKRADEIEDSATWEAISERLAVGIINLSAVLTPDVIILGGGVGGHLDRFQQYLDEQIKKLTPSGVQVPPVAQAQHPEEAVIYGCYELARQASADAPAA